MDYATYYQSITKPFFAPPEWVFGLAWGIIYPLIGIAVVYLIFLWFMRRGTPQAVPISLVWVFAANLLANAVFTPLQLTLQSTLLATLDILVILGTLLFLEWKMWKYSKVIFFLLLPYLLWGAFATILQISIVFLN